MLISTKDMGIVRSSFLIDKNGIVQKTGYKISAKNTVPELLKALDYTGRDDSCGINPSSI